MVKVREDHPITLDGAIDLDAWLKRLKLKRESTQMQLLRRAAELTFGHHEALTATGASCCAQGLEMAEILAGLNLDTDTLVASVVYNSVESGALLLEAVEKELGPSIAKLVVGVSEMEAIRSLHSRKTASKLDPAQQVDRLRKMILAMVDDARVVLIKLAEWTCVLRAVKYLEEEDRVKAARVTMDIYAPLANRLGIGQIKWELEDLAFRYLQPDQYKHIASSLDEKRIARDRYIKNLVATLKSELAKNHIEGADVNGRAKHIYSIWRKMQRKGVGFDEIYDVRAVRVLVNEIRDCYAVLGIVHSLWQHIPREFDDYIATPKENGYRSLHTAVIGPEGKVVEVQIRTHQMHSDSELGVAAHWRYKEGRKADGTAAYESKINWLRQVLEWQEDVTDARELMDNLRQEVVEERVYVFTPTGDVVDLPLGATPLDFAYHVHTSIGHRCRGAKINGRIVPLTYQLKTGEQVEILTAKQGTPSRDWLNPHLGFIKSSRARSKIHHWFKQQDRDQNLADGKAMLDKELQRLSMSGVNFDALAKKFNYQGPEDLFVGIGAGDVRITQVTNAAQEFAETSKPKEELIPAVRTKPKKARTRDDVTVHGIGNLLTQFAQCCKPVPGDAIVGYISIGRGVTVHRADCAHVLRAQESKPERLVEVEWGTAGISHYQVDIAIKSHDRQGLLRDITIVLADAHVNVVGATTHTNRSNSICDMILTLEIESLSQLSRVLAQIARLPNVIEAARKM